MKSLLKKGLFLFLKSIKYEKSTLSEAFPNLQISKKSSRILLNGEPTTDNPQQTTASIIHFSLFSIHS